MTLCTCGPSQFDKVALPAIIDYKVTEARCEKLPKLLPQLFSEVPEVDRRYANPNRNRNPNPNPNQVENDSENGPDGYSKLLSPIQAIERLTSLSAWTWLAKLQEVSLDF